MTTDISTSRAKGKVQPWSVWLESARKAYSKVTPDIADDDLLRLYAQVGPAARIPKWDRTTGRKLKQSSVDARTAYNCSIIRQFKQTFGDDPNYVAALCGPQQTPLCVVGMAPLNRTAITGATFCSVRYTEMAGRTHAFGTGAICDIYPKGSLQRLRSFWMSDSVFGMYVLITIVFAALGSLIFAVNKGFLLGIAIFVGFVSIVYAIAFLCIELRRRFAGNGWVLSSPRAVLKSNVGSRSQDFVTNESALMSQVFDAYIPSDVQRGASLQQSVSTGQGSS